MKDLIQKALEKMNQKGDGDTIDRLSSTTTVMMLTAFSIVVTAAGLMIVQPVKCFVPAEMTDAMKDYIENYCFVQGTFFIPFEQRVNQSSPRSYQYRSGQSVERKGVEMIGYYQWVPLILLLQAVMFYVPRVFWRVASNVSGVNFNGMLKMARCCLTCAGDKREQHYRSVADYVTWALNLHQAARRRSSCWEVWDRFISWHMIVVFMLSKILYVANAVGQIYLLDALLQTNDTLYGITVIKQLVNGTQWQSSGLFPRSTMCDVPIRETLSGNMNPVTVQCVLVVNVFNEKLFIFLWFWTMFVAVASSFSLICYLITISFPGNRRRFIRRLLPYLPVDKHQAMASEVPKFVNDYLGHHGVFLLRSISDCIGSIVASKVATYMWSDFIKNVASRRNTSVSVSVVQNRQRGELRRRYVSNDPGTSSGT